MPLKKLLLYDTSCCLLLLAEGAWVVLRALFLSDITRGETSRGEGLCARKLINLGLHHLKWIILLCLLLLLRRSLFLLAETKWPAILSLLLSLNGKSVVIFNFRLGNFYDLLAIIELLLYNKRVNDFTRLAWCESMLLSLWHYLLFLDDIVGLLLSHRIFDSPWDVIRVNNEVVDVNLDEAWRCSIFLLCNLRRGHFFYIEAGSWSWLSWLNKVSTDDNLSRWSRLLLIRRLMK